MERSSYKKWNYEVWRAAVQEQHSGEQHLVITVGGAIALEREPLGRAYEGSLGGPPMHQQKWHPVKK